MWIQIFHLNIRIRILKVPIYNVWFFYNISKNGEWWSYIIVYCSQRNMLIIPIIGIPNTIIWIHEKYLNTLTRVSILYNSLDSFTNYTYIVISGFKIIPRTPSGHHPELRFRNALIKYYTGWQAYKREWDIIKSGVVFI